MSQVQIVAGSYRKTDVSGKVFELVEGFKTSAKGGFVTVKNTGEFQGNTTSPNIRITVEGPMSYQFVNGVEAVATPAIVADAIASEETDEQVMIRIKERFEILDQMSTAATNGDIRAMIVSGPPGVGKSFGVEQVVEKAVLFDKIAGKRLRAEVVKGSATALGLYQILYKYSDANSVVVFDDCDEIFYDQTALNLLKGALDTGKNRKISWLSESHSLRREGIPDSFTFKGAVIFITNIDFTNCKSKTLKPHLEALQSRCHYVDLTINSLRDKLLRIKQVIADGMLDEYNLDDVAKTEVVEFLTTNADKLREVISLRSAIKIAELRKAFPQKWAGFARTSLLKG